MSTLSPTLSQWLESLGLKKLLQIFVGVGVKSPEDLSWLSDNDLDVMVKEPMERIKIKIAIRQLQSSKFRQTVAITPEEDRAIKQLDDTTAKARKILGEVQDTIKATKHSSSKAKTEIRAASKRIMEAVTRRENELIGLLDKETASKIDDLNKQSMHISGILTQCSQAERASFKLLNAADVRQLSKRERDIKQSLANILDAKIDMKPVTDSGILFVGDIEPVIKMVVNHGDIMLGGAPTPPNITQIEAIGNSVKVSWEPEIPNLEQPGVDNVEKLQGNVLRYCIKIAEREEKCAEGEVVWEKEAVCEAKETTYTFKNLKAEHEYSAQVKAMNDVSKIWGNFGKIKTVKTVKTVKLKGHEIVWDVNKKGRELEISGNRLTSTGSTGLQSICLAETVYRNGKHSFQVEILCADGGKHIVIGIAPEDTNIQPTGQQYPGDSTYPNGYGYYCLSGAVFHNGSVLETEEAIPNDAGDVVTVTIDIDNQTIQFDVNGKTFPQRSIKIIGPVCPAVSMQTSGNNVGIKN